MPYKSSRDTWNSWYSLNAPLDPLGPPLDPLGRSRSHVLSYKASEDLSNVVVKLLTPYDTLDDVCLDPVDFPLDPLESPWRPPRTLLLFDPLLFHCQRE